MIRILDYTPQGKATVAISNTHGNDPSYEICEFCGQEAIKFSWKNCRTIDREGFILNVKVFLTVCMGVLTGQRQYLANIASMCINIVGNRQDHASSKKLTSCKKQQNTI